MRLDLVENAVHSDPAARALTVLRPVLAPEDLPRIAAWAQRFEQSPLLADPENRAAKYARSLEVYVRHKYRSDPSVRGPEFVRAALEP